MTSNKQIHWHDYDVAKATKCVKQYQTAIAVAYSKGNTGESERYQHNLIRSRSAAYVAVRRVARLNRGKGTPGIDGAAQSLWQMALDPIAEWGADQNSYGFRKAGLPMPGM